MNQILASLTLFGCLVWASTLPAQDINSYAGTIGDKNFQEEIKATSEQVRKLEQLASDYHKAIQNPFDAPDMGEFLVESSKHFERELKATLTPQQLKRFDQILIHQSLNTYSGGRLLDFALSLTHFKNSPVVDADLKSELYKLRNETNTKLIKKADELFNKVGQRIRDEETNVFAVLNEDQQMMAKVILGDEILTSEPRLVFAINQILKSEGKLGQNELSFDEVEAKRAFLRGGDASNVLEMMEEQRARFLQLSDSFDNDWFALTKEVSGNAEHPDFSKKLEKLESDFVKRTEDMLLELQHDLLLVLSTRRYVRLESNGRLVHFLLGVMKSELKLEESQVKSMTKIREKSNSSLFELLPKLMKPIERELNAENQFVKSLLKSHSIDLDELMGERPTYIQREKWLLSRAFLFQSEPEFQKRKRELEETEKDSRK